MFNFILGHASGIKMTWVSIHQNLFSYKRACVRVYEGEKENVRDRECSDAENEYGVAVLRCNNNMLNLNKTTDFARFGERPLCESAASESGSSGI